MFIATIEKINGIVYNKLNLQYCFCQLKVGEDMPWI